MNFDFSPEANRLRAEIRAALAEEWPAGRTGYRLPENQFDYDAHKVDRQWAPPYVALPIRYHESAGRRLWWHPDQLSKRDAADSGRGLVRDQREQGQAG